MNPIPATFGAADIFPAQKRIWVVDDDETASILAQEVLETAGFTVRTFLDAATALAACDHDVPDLVVVDVIMPGMDGFEFCTRLRGLPQGREIPVLVTTSLDDTASIDRAYQVGATTFATKPLNWAIEVHRLRYMLRTADIGKELARRSAALQEQVAAKERANEELKEVQQQLIETSRRAGMAEVATGVLHNVGNVLNSVNVSLTLLRENLRNSKAPSLGRVARLLELHKDDLAAFFTIDPKGKLVPEFLLRLAEHLMQEHAAAEKEYDQLTGNIEHIKAIVTMQQNHAKFAGFREKVALHGLVEEALHLCMPGLLRHGVEVLRHYSEVPEITTDKHRVLQILVNLTRNAQLALAESERPDKQLIVRLDPSPDGGANITIADNGIGIPPENLIRIFSHGFTTRKGGHGFGLHSGANAAKELGGQLRAQSAGPGQGAAFILYLPAAMQDPEPSSEHPPAKRLPDARNRNNSRAGTPVLEPRNSLLRSDRKVIPPRPSRREARDEPRPQAGPG